MSTSSYPALPNRQGEPVMVLKDDRTVSKGRQAQLNNIAAARLITEIVRTSLGPHGMDKMLISDYGVVNITNDGATMLKEMSVLHPAGKILVELSKSTDTSVGDGTTSAVVLAGALLEKADELLKKGVHPVQVVSGFSKASKFALSRLRELGTTVPRTKETLMTVARTSMQTKVIAEAAPKLAQLVADAVLMVAREREGRHYVDMKSIKVEKKEGGSVSDTTFIRGIVLNQTLVHPEMPKRLEKARIAIITYKLSLEDDTLQKQVVIRDPTLVKRFIEQEASVLKSMVDRIRSKGADLIICQKAMDEVVKDHIGRSGMMGIEKAYEYEMPKIAWATGARIVNSVEDLSEKDLGYADVIEERKVHGGKLLFIEGCKDPKAVTILIRGGSTKVVDEAERAVHDALMVARDVMQEPDLVPGGGAVESELAFAVREWARNLEGREQLAAEMFADALEQIPATLAENAGMNRVAAAAELRAKHAQGHESFGISKEGKVRDMKELGVLEPLMVKRQVISSATEAASMILRVDNIVTAPPAGPGPRSGIERPKELDQPLGI